MPGGEFTDDAVFGMYSKSGLMDTGAFVFPAVMVWSHNAGH